MAGFVLLVIGTLVYNEIIEIPIEFMNYNTKANIKKREEEKLALGKLKKGDLESDINETHETKSTSQKNKMV